MRRTKWIIPVLSCWLLAHAHSDELAQIDSLMGQEKFDESLALLRKLEEKDAQDPDIHSRIGEVLFRRREYSSALTPLQKAVAVKPDHRRAIQYLGSSLYFLGRLEEAIPYLERSLEWFPDNINFLNVLALSYVQTQQPQKAHEIFSRIFTLPLGSAQAHFITGQMFRQQDIWGPAAEELNRALALNPAMPMAHLYLGEIFFARRMLNEALQEFHKEIELNPGMWMAYYRSGEVLFELGKGGEAIPSLERAIWLNKFFAGPYLLIGRIHLRERRLEQAIDHFRRAVELEYTNSEAHYLLGRALAQEGRREEAQKEFELSKEFRRTR